MMINKWCYFLLALFSIESCTSPSSFNNDGADVEAFIDTIKKENSYVIVEYRNDSNTIKSEKFLKRGIEFGNQYFYNDSGLIDKFCFANVNSENIFCCTYLEERPVAAYGSSVYSVLNKKSLSIGDTFDALIFLAIPPKLKYEIELSKNVDGDFIAVDENNYLVNNNLDYATVVSINEPVIVNKDFQMRLILNLYSENNKKVFHSDTSNLNVTVKN